MIPLADEYANKNDAMDKNTVSTRRLHKTIFVPQPNQERVPEVDPNNIRLVGLLGYAPRHSLFKNLPIIPSKLLPSEFVLEHSSNTGGGVFEC
ncbi:MAG: hypothetical protein ABSF63_11825 [Candidatus Bathyarchaeia archaeon]|jgi:hypothetical protein